MKSIGQPQSKLVLTLVLVVLVLPVVIYTAIFGLSLSTSHARWSEFGSFIGGVYAPVAGFFTLAIIAGQLSSQVRFNKHQIDQSFLSNSRADLHFYIDQLHSILAKHEKLANVPLSHALISMFGSRTHEQLRGGLHLKDVQRIGMTDGRICAIWGAIYTILSGLRAVDESDYRLVHTSSIQKCIAMFGYGVCDALDNFHYVSCNYPDNFAYEFHRPPKG